ncbi:hypothetical protein YC2023_025153 [Brassica napus]
MKNTVTPDAIYAVLSNPSFRLALRLLSKSWISSLSAIDNLRVNTHMSKTTNSMLLFSAMDDHKLGLVSFGKH